MESHLPEEQQLKLCSLSHLHFCLMCSLSGDKAQVTHSHTCRVVAELVLKQEPGLTLGWKLLDAQKTADLGNSLSIAAGLGFRWWVLLSQDSGCLLPPDLLQGLNPHWFHIFEFLKRGGRSRLRLLLLLDWSFLHRLISLLLAGLLLLLLLQFPFGLKTL